MEVLWPPTKAKRLQKTVDVLESGLGFEKGRAESALKCLTNIHNIVQDARNNWREVYSHRAIPDSFNFESLPMHVHNIVREREQFENHVQELEQKNRGLQNSVQDYRAKTDPERMALKETHARQESALLARIRNLEDANNGLADRLEKMKIDHGEEINGLKTSHAKEKAQMTAYYKQEKEKLRKDRDALSSALLSRDDFKPTPDIEMIAKFQKVAQDVENLARLEWRKDQDVWASKMLSHLTLNPRLLKKQLLQDGIWTLLHEYVFCSPFRALGEEGKSLEKQWNQECGEDSQMKNEQYTWPKPDIETERWRYVNVKECRSALRQPAPSEWDPRALLKKGFVQHREVVRMKLITMLESIVELDNRSLQAVSDLVKDAASMWFELGTQRCRIMIIMQGSVSGLPKDKILQAQEGHVNLLTLPELRRCGNSKGINLEMQEVMGACQRELVQLGKNG